MIAAIILSLVSCCPNHPLHKSDDLRSEVAGYFADAGERYDIDPVLLAYWAYRESSLRTDVVGKLGEVGLCQAHGKSASMCRRAGLGLETHHGGVYCMGYLMAAGRAHCGTLEAGLNYYASGSCKGTPRSRRIVKQRLRKAAKLRSEK